VGFLSYRTVYVIVKTRKRNFFSYTGKVGEAKEDIKKGEEGYVMVEGEMWKAIPLEDVTKGDKVVVVKMEGLKLVVKRQVRNEERIQ